MSAGKKFKGLVKTSKPLTTVRAINAYSALQVTKIGRKALYLSGSGVASTSYDLPDLGIIAFEEVCIDVRRACPRADTPLSVDTNTDSGGSSNIARVIKELTRAGATVTHTEDRVIRKRCGHCPNRELVSTEEMYDRIKAVVDAKIDPSLVTTTKTDAHAIEGQQKAIERVLAYTEIGAEMVLVEVITSLEKYEEFVKNVRTSTLANVTEFGKAPYFTKEELNRVGVSMMLYPLNANRTMNKVAVQVYEGISKNGHQKDIPEIMQTKEELYEILDHHSHEQKSDELFRRGVK